MTPVSRFVFVVALLCLPLLARAEGKCNDDPFLLEDQTSLGVAWSIPMVKAQVNRGPTATLLADLDGLFGNEPDGFPAEYSAGLAVYDFPKHAKTDKEHVSRKQVEDWLADFKIPLKEPAKTALDEYFAGQKCAAKPGATKKVCSITGLDCDDVQKPCDKVLSYGWVVQHPPAENNGSGYTFCTCTLQRAALVFTGDKEELWVRTRFRSARPASAGQTAASANFVASKPVVFTFDSKRIWFPLALNKLYSEPGKPAWLLLDVLTKTPLDLNKIPDGFTLTRMTKTFRYLGTDWSVTRITRRYEQGGAAADLLVEP